LKDTVALTDIPVGGYGFFMPFCSLSNSCLNFINPWLSII
jgi:hypothetical protein